ncbi:uridine kinase [Roseivirga pacifica]|jgi:uridine kinase|uniref:Uridine kinase n=1 Tax=Roseivirga pacifica TaxID=1267423 RepID=A0A1I0NIW7_9BACT|nr:uridine kinase [Roseivirga pacifica]MCO6359763.1 uridine kinase [Roseivirga pacifica]MCO6367133.1 uridine kinase [Roseivirga pacifica]MCO6370335.1 uridine kinase [Roseivirga pacifica]MCO6374790.1 uridine kinase [Roseivirga pacifica]MCO6380048.1 uridine kinase [Roseivirga pacifica]|tara:strand:+ start:92 stop:706 length:615 start_codon:yes stop_codon:yes gene_type:complete
MEKPYIIGITGGTGSGKSLFLSSIIKEFDGRDVTCLSQDDYYRPREHQLVDKNGEYNFDRPESIDYEHFAADLKTLSAGKAIEKEEYTFNNPEKKPKLIVRKAAPVILVEGIFIFHYQKIRELIDLKVFIDAKEHIKLKRRLKRDREERGYDANDVLYKYENHIMPSYQKYIYPYKEAADLVIPNNTNFEQALDVLKAFINSKI